MQFQADLLGCPVMRSDVPELSAIGAALLARKALLRLGTVDLQRYLPEHVAYHPDISRHQQLKLNYAQWHAAVKTALNAQGTCAE